MKNGEKYPDYNNNNNNSILVNIVYENWILWDIQKWLVYFMENPSING